MNEEQLKEKAKELGLDFAEKAVKELVLPFLKQKVQDSESNIDDMIYGAAEGALLELADKINGKVD